MGVAALTFCCEDFLMLYSYETAFGDTFPILGDPGAVSRVDKMFVVKVYRKIILGDTGAVSRVDKIYRPD